MTSLTPEALDAISVALWHFGTVFLRVGALVSVLPAFGERTVPVRVRLAVAIAFTAVVAPAIPALPAPDGLLVVAALIGVETLTGMALGFGLRVFILALQTAGSIAAQSTSLSQMLGAANADPAPAMGHLLIIAGLALAVMTGLHVRAAEFLILTYDIVPTGMRPNAQALSAWGLARVAEAFSLAFLLAAPFVIASFIYNLALGVINRAMPQLMVALVGAPAITLGGLVLLLVAAPILLTVWLQQFYAFFGSGGGLLP